MINETINTKRPTKVKIITDSACDIPFDKEKELDISILPVPLVIDGKSYFERLDFTFEEFFQQLHTCKEIPTTSFINHIKWMEAYEDAYNAGYSDIIVITINSKGSNMFQGASMAVEGFYEAHPDAKEKEDFTITVLDSLTYTLAYGYPVMKAAEIAKAGKTKDEVLSYLSENLHKYTAVFSIYTLEFAKKSGRIKCAAAFVGELLGLRPIMHLADGAINIAEKVRGDKATIAAMCKRFMNERAEGNNEYLLVRGEDEDNAKELEAALTEAVGYPPIGIYPIGASVSINAGPKMCGVIFKRK